MHVYLSRDRNQNKVCLYCYIKILNSWSRKSRQKLKVDLAYLPLSIKYQALSLKKPAKNY